MKKENYLEMIPEKTGNISWREDKDGLVVLQVKHKRLMDKAAQKLFSRPSVTNVHLDRYGSWIWKEIDGRKTVMELADSLKKQFGEETEPLYPRIVRHFQRMEQCRLAKLDHRAG